MLMNAIELCELLLRSSLSSQAARHSRWITVSHRLGEIPGHSALAYDLQQAGMLDCVVSELESCLAQRLNSEQPNVLILAPECCAVLGKSWLSLTFEVLRTFKQRLS